MVTGHLLPFKDFQQLHWSDNLDTLELSKIQKVRVAGHDVIHLTGDGAFAPRARRPGSTCLHLIFADELLVDWLPIPNTTR
jgi:hypothetical protein